ncbi:CotH kinase family protein [Adhaeribacter radiodurans]|uniref:CotH kinase family protein n=1 Tax=Adhaeribacter radiodurans TaxID=2745197 RepID=A0A7L7LEY5_9BACT|nr:CotH kinase family protein [Adhaeribacter radiodurans]QMU31391.1 CotH kinase family protein [Adhaeribacter radiodurans]
MERQVRVFIWLLLIFISCKKEEENPVAEISKFQFEAQKNARVLQKNIDFKIEGNSIEATVPAGTNLTNLIATFSTTGKQVRVNNIIQESGITINDFSKPLNYVVEAADGSKRTYQVFVNPDSEGAKDIVSFKFEEKNNPAQLLEDVVSQIEDNKIVAIIPYTSGHKNLIATFTTTGKTVKVADMVQESGVTVNDFSQPLKYVVEAEDGTQKEYLVEIHSFTGLPIIYINTENRAGITSKDDYIKAQMKLEGDHSNGSGTFNSAIEIRGRGNTTWLMPKKPFKIKLAEKAALLGMPADKEWSLLANFSDKSLMRNAVAFELSRRFGLPYTPRSRFVEVFINGEYLGNYLLTEHLKVAKDRVNIQELKPTDNAEDVITGGYFLEVDARLDEDYWFHTQNNIPITIKSPDDISPQQLSYIKNYVQAAESAIYSIGSSEAKSTYEQYIDTESFVNWYLVNELLKNNDAAFHSSVYLYKDRGGKLTLGPVWDFDIALGNINYNGNESPQGWWLQNSPWIGQLFQDPAFRTKVKERWREVKQKDINSLFTYINSTAVQLKYSQKENFEKWNILDTYAWPNIVVMGSYENEVQYLKDWLSTRINWMDTEMNTWQ